MGSSSMAGILVALLPLYTIRLGLGFGKQERQGDSVTGGKGLVSMVEASRRTNGQIEERKRFSCEQVLNRRAIGNVDSLLLQPCAKLLFIDTRLTDAHLALSITTAFGGAVR